MLRFVRLNDRAIARTVGSRGLTLLVVALAAGGCSAGFDRLGPLNYSGGPTGSAAPLPPEPMRHGRATPPPVSDYRPAPYQPEPYRTAPQPADSYRPDHRSDMRPDQRSDPSRDYQPGYRPDDPPAYRPPYGSDRRSDAGSRAAPPLQRGDDSVRVAGLPEPYDRTPAARPAPKVAPFEATRTPPAPPRSALDTVPLDTAGASAAGETIEVRPGDTIFALAKKHNVSMAELMRVNNLKGTHLSIGQQLTLPTEGQRDRRVASLPTPAPTPYVPPAPSRRTVSPPPISPTPFAAAPPSTDVGPIVPPLVETPPSAAPAAPSLPPAAPIASRADDTGWTGTHTVGRGDSLYAIARKHGIKLNELERANNITNPRTIKPGTVLKVPQAGDAPQVARAPTSSQPSPSVLRAPEPPTATPEASGPPSVRPTILNPGAEKKGDERTRVAALERNPAAAEPSSSPAPSALPPAIATDAPQRDAALTGPRPAAAIGKFRWPARGKIIAGFGPGQNEGINISLPVGTPIHAAESGTVYYAGDGVQGYGNIILIRHAEGWITAYAHNDQLLVKAGESVRRGQIIAKAGNSGSVSQPQLHFEVRQGTKAVDPMEHLER